MTSGNRPEYAPASRATLVQLHNEAQDSITAYVLEAQKLIQARSSDLSFGLVAMAQDQLVKYGVLKTVSKRRTLARAVDVAQKASIGKLDIYTGTAIATETLRGGDRMHFRTPRVSTLADGNALLAYVRNSRPKGMRIARLGKNQL